MLPNLPRIGSYKIIRPDFRRTKAARWARAGDGVPNPTHMLTAVTGINWGDEGKGRIVDLLAEDADVVVRYQGGNNAGHTVVNQSETYVFNLLPSGILHPRVTCVLGDGMVVDLDHLRHELSMMDYFHVRVSPDNLKLSARATICMPFHIRQDVLEEERLARSGNAFGSTRRGIAYAYGDKYRKKTLRLGDLLHLEEPSVLQRLRMILDSKNLLLTKVYGQSPISEEEAIHWCRDQSAFFAPYICDTGDYLEAATQQGARILLEAQLGALRDIDCGIFPYTSSSNTIAAYAPVGAGMPGVSLDHVVGVMKAYSTCVGAGPFTAEKAMTEGWNDTLRKLGGEFGAATGRPRRVGPFDAVASRYGLRCQRADKIALTKLDVLGGLDEIPVITAYQIKGRILSEFRTDAELEHMKPVVEMLPGWKCDISQCRSWEELPENARRYVQRVEELIGCQLHLISVGAERNACFPRSRDSWLF